MATLSEAAAFANDYAVRSPIMAAIAAAAVAILNEDPNTPNHEERTALGRMTLRQPALVAERFAWAMSSNPTIVGKHATGDVDGAISDFAYVVSTVWDAIAFASDDAT